MPALCRLRIGTMQTFSKMKNLVNFDKFDIKEAEILFGLLLEVRTYPHSARRPDMELKVLAWLDELGKSLSSGKLMDKGVAKNLLLQACTWKHRLDEAASAVRFYRLQCLLLA